MPRHRSTYSPAGASRSSRAASTSFMIAVAVTILDIENHRYDVRGVAGVASCTSAAPKPAAQRTRSRSTTAMDRPGTWAARIMLVTAACTAGGAAPTAFTVDASSGGDWLGLIAAVLQLEFTARSQYHAHMVRTRSSFVKPLSEPEVRQQDVDVLFMVWLVSRSTEALLDAALAPVGLTGDEMAMYSMLAAAPSTTPTELSRWMAAPATTVSSYVKRLQARGHVTRDPNPEDRRSSVIRLTAEGRRIHDEAKTRMTPVRAAVERALTDTDGVNKVLLRLRGAVDTVRTSRTPR